MTIEQELLHERLSPRAGEVIAHRRFQVATDFRPDTTLCAIYIDQPDVQILDVGLSYGPLKVAPKWNHERWDNEAGDNLSPGIPSGMDGMRVQHGAGLLVDGFSARGFPRSGIDAFGISGGVLKNLSFAYCFQGLTMRQYQRSRGVLIDGVFGRDMWGPGPGHWPGIGGYPSVSRPGEFIGSDVLAVGVMDDSIVRNVHARGEYLRAAKFVDLHRCDLSHLSGSCIMFQGSYGASGTSISDTVLRDSIIDKRLGYGECTEKISHALQCSLDVELRVERCTFSANGKLGHGSQHAVRTRGEYRDCVFHGFNQAPAGYQSYALELSDATCSTNADFEAANRFVDQANVLKRAA